VTCVAAPAAGCRGTVLLRDGARVVGRGRFHVRQGRRRVIDAVLSRGGLRHVRMLMRRERGPLSGVLLDLGARVRDGLVSGAGTRGAVIDRIVRRP
jgi:hypothetical protein